MGWILGLTVLVLVVVPYAGYLLARHHARTCVGEGCFCGQPPGWSG